MQADITVAVPDTRFWQYTRQAHAGNGATCTPGRIMLTAGVTAVGVPAQGQRLPISQNTALFSLLGTLYGGYRKFSTSMRSLPDSSYCE